MKKVLLVLSMFALATFAAFATGSQEPKAAGPVSLSMWTQESENENSYQYVQSLIAGYVKDHPTVTIHLLQKNTEALRQDFLTASLAGQAPDFLWTVSDHAGPFTAAGVIQPVGKLFDLSKYVSSAVDAVRLDGQEWGVPISNGNELMLLYNKSLVPTPPQNTDELIKMGKELTKDGVYGLVFNQVEPFWLVPWLGGFGGKVFAEDGKTPTLNTPQMVSTLQFLYDLKYKYQIIPKESDYAAMDSLFKTGKAAMIINGDWSLGEYQKLLGDKLGVARIPKVSATGMWPAPYTSGKFFMLSKDLAGEKLAIVKDFINWATDKDNQLTMVKDLARLPALKVALSDPLITSDPILKGAAEQMTVGTPMPIVVQMRAVWDAMKPEMNAVLSNSESPAAAAAKMQQAAVTGIQNMH